MSKVYPKLDSYNIQLENHWVVWSSDRDLIFGDKDLLVAIAWVREMGITGCVYEHVPMSGWGTAPTNKVARTVLVEAVVETGEYYQGVPYEEGKSSRSIR